MDFVEVLRVKDETNISTFLGDGRVIIYMVNGNVASTEPIYDLPLVLSSTPAVVLIASSVRNHVLKGVMGNDIFRITVMLYHGDS